MFRLYQPPAWQPQSILLAIDEPSLNAYGGVPGLRKPLAEALRLIAPASPKAVAVDLILADNDRSRRRMRAWKTPCAPRSNLVLACHLLPDGSAWEDPLPRFRAQAAALGHVHAEPDRTGFGGRSPCRWKKPRAGVRRWALSLEAYRVSRGNAQILESPSDLEVGGR